METATYQWGTGRRKEAVARVRLKKGTGKVLVNGTDMNKYFLTEHERNLVMTPLVATKTTGQFDVLARLHGGGKAGQAGAMLLGIARALKQIEQIHEAKLREDGLLTRDPRMKERKKYGRRGARRSFQFSKR